VITFSFLLLTNIRVIKSRRMRWAGRGMKHVLGRRDVNTGLWWDNLRERDYLEELDIDWRIILKWIFQK